MMMSTLDKATKISLGVAVGIVGILISSFLFIASIDAKASEAKTVNTVQDRELLRQAELIESIRRVGSSIPPRRIGIETDF